MKVSIAADEREEQIIQELLSPWDISYTPHDESDVTIVYGKNPSAFSQTIVIPSCSASFDRWTKSTNRCVTKKHGNYSVRATSELALSIIPELTYECKVFPKENEDLSAILAFDIVNEYKRIMRETLCAKASLSYTLFTTLPLPYNIIPRRFRNTLMKRGSIAKDFNVSNILPIDALRFELLRKIEHLSEKKIRLRGWGQNKKCVCAITHDVETRAGLFRSVKIKKLEEKYDISSAWYIPSAEYSLDRETIATLANSGEVGSHDTKHDGRLSSLSEKTLTARLQDSKSALEKIVKNKVVGFRAPLLQHNPDIFSSLKDCGYQYDTSVPTWEAKHPRTMRCHGIGTIFPISISGIRELPVTIMQDHQFLYVLGYAPKEVVAAYLTTLTVIKELGGACVLLIHPEYGLLDSKGLPLYEELLSSIACDNEILIELPRKICASNTDKRTTWTDENHVYS
ncbi:MAG: polysaccharide deacetylase family protein [Candidatus Bathyarchaeia archaeon]|jgi:peptidoglycan/xylan/chitin deacetylase (PgdA/CDA1 family)